MVRSVAERAFPSVRHVLEEFGDMMILTGKTIWSALRPPYPYGGEFVSQFWDFIQTGNVETGDSVPLLVIGRGRGELEGGLAPGPSPSTAIEGEPNGKAPRRLRRMELSLAGPRPASARGGSTSLSCPGAEQEFFGARHGDV